MKTILLYVFILLTLFLSIEVNAETHEDLVHISAHMGNSYVVTLVSDQVYNKWFHVSSNTSMALGFLTTIVAGSVYKLVETGNPARMKDNMIYNAAGALGAIGTVWVFNLNM